MKITVMILVSFLITSQISFSQTADHVVISEVQIGGTTTYDEFVELHKQLKD